MRSDVDAERCLMSLLHSMMPRIDPARAGWFVEIGCGTFMYFFEHLVPLGFRAVAVEPLVVPALRQACQRSGTALVEACVAASDGAATMYVGTYLGQQELNVSSLHSGWWGASAQAVRVPAITLARLLENVPSVAALKVDVEGSEDLVLRQLLDLPPAKMPKLVCFEFVGEGHQLTMSRPEGREFAGKSLVCLETLRQVGYGVGVVLDSAASDVAAIRVFDLRRDANDDLAPFFGPQADWGNVLVAHPSGGIDQHFETIARAIISASIGPAGDAKALLMLTKD